MKLLNLLVLNRECGNLIPIFPYSLLRANKLHHRAVPIPQPQLGDKLISKALLHSNDAQSTVCLIRGKVLPAGVCSIPLWYAVTMYRGYLTM